MWKFNLCDYKDVYILVRGDITVIEAPAIEVTFRHCARLIKCITKNDDLDLVMAMYNLIEYSSTYSETTENLWFYSKDETSDFNNNISNTGNLKSSKYKAKLLQNTVAQDDNAANCCAIKNI